MPYRTRMTTMFAALVAFAATACSDSTGARTGQLSLRLTDAPGDVVKAVVTIDQIYVVPGEDDETGRTVLRDEDVTVDLLTLANETADLVDDFVLPAGTYHQLRFVVSGAYIEVENADGTTSVYATSPNYAGLPPGETVDGQLKTPSFSTSGFKVILPGEGLTVPAGGAKVMLVDFDVSQSFGHDAGNSGSWVLTPVVKATDIALSGGITVTLAKPATLTLPTGVAMTDFKAVLTDAAADADTVAFTDANADGVFEAAFPFEPAGTYTLNLAAPTGVTFTTTETRPVTITLTSGGTVTQAFNLATVTK
jgi:hypothetical protein